jgi:YD repeat-containing protein
LTNQTDQTFDALGHLTQVQLPTASLVTHDDTQPVDTRPALNYEYDAMGNKTAEIDAKGNKIEYGYDQLGRVITVTTKATNHLTEQPSLVTAVTKNYYDNNGNKVKVIDPNNKEWNYTYAARGWLLTEKDPEGNITRYHYDALGNKVGVTDPRNKTGYSIVNDKVVINDITDNRTFTTWYIYNDLNRLVRTVLPDNTPPDDTDLKNGNYDNPFVEITYDEDGNKTGERDANGVLTEYTYTPRNQVEKVSFNGKVASRRDRQRRSTPAPARVRRPGRCPGRPATRRGRTGSGHPPDRGRRAGRGGGRRRRDGSSRSRR